MIISRALKNGHGFQSWLRPLCCCFEQNTAFAVPLSTGNRFDKIIEETRLGPVIRIVTSCFRSEDQDACHFQLATRLVNYKVSIFTRTVHFSSREGMSYQAKIIQLAPSWQFFQASLIWRKVVFHRKVKLHTASLGGRLEFFYTYK